MYYTTTIGCLELILKSVMNNKILVWASKVMWLHDGTMHKKSFSITFIQKHIYNHNIRMRTH